MNSTVTLLLNSKEETDTYQFRVFAFGEVAGEKGYKDISSETYFKLRMTSMKELVNGNASIPPVSFRDGKILATLEEPSEENFYRYYEELIHRCIDSTYTTGVDFFVTDEMYQKLTRHSIVGLGARELAEYWMIFMRTCKDEDDYVEKVNAVE